MKSPVKIKKKAAVGAKMGSTPPKTKKDPTPAQIARLKKRTGYYPISTSKYNEIMDDDEPEGKTSYYFNPKTGSIGGYNAGKKADDIRAAYDKKYKRKNPKRSPYANMDVKNKKTFGQSKFDRIASAETTKSSPVTVSKPASATKPSFTPKMATVRKSKSSKTEMKKGGLMKSKSVVKKTTKKSYMKKGGKMC
jgi:hypothetical protein